MSAEQRTRRTRISHLLAGWPDRDQFELGRLIGRLNDAVGDIEDDTPAARSASKRKPGRASSGSS